MMSPSWKLLGYAMALFSCLACVTSQQQPYNYDYPTGNLSTLWINAFNSNILENRTSMFHDSSIVRPILLRFMAREDDSSRGRSPAFACGFYCIGTCDSFLFGIYIIYAYDEVTGPAFGGIPQVVWSANRNNPVGENAALNLTVGGDLALKDADGRLVWSTNTAGKDVAGLNLTEEGNLVLYDANDSVIWQSFDHPTDCLLVGQRLPSGKNLTAAASPTNWSEGMYSVSMTKTGFVASLLSHPPQVYYKISYSETVSYAIYQKGSLELYANTSGSSSPFANISTRSTRTQYMKMDYDGHLRVFDWDDDWTQVADILGDNPHDCSYPMSCGKYGICSKGQCSCPGTRFRHINSRQTELGCAEVIPLTCDALENHTFVRLSDVTYFAFAVTDFNFTFDILNTDIRSCKDACLKNCSCKAALFLPNSNYSYGNCYLPTDIFSFMSDEMGRNGFTSFVYIKVQKAASPTVEKLPVGAKGKTNFLRPILGSILGFLCAVALIGTALFVYSRRKRETEDAEEDHLDHVPGMPTRFSFEELAAATDNFSKKLGEGGFGSVYEGSLGDGTGIAVKRLDGVGHIRKSFLAEVETIGSIHHVNLVKLVGFCADKSHRLLVYEYMCNGSLDKWIYSGRNEATIDWNLRRKVILDIAKGLTYLHEECRQKILHLDIKPQNILLDEHFNAKVADFGLAKLIDRNQSQVVATMRGTPGYLAPEWLSAVITEKVDVYSFGMVILEILTGRRIFEQARPEEDQHLLAAFKRKLEEGNWLDLVDECCRNVESDVAEVEKLMRISAWCLQVGYEKRPSMSMVIKVLEGVREVPEDIDYERLIPQYLGGTIPEGSSHDQGLTALLPSVLSTPR